MRTGVQFTGTVPALWRKRWVTHSWPAGWQVVWSVVPTSPGSGRPQIEWEVEVQRASPEHVTYWITVRNLTWSSVTVEARYAVLNEGG